MNKILKIGFLFLMSTVSLANAKFLEVAIFLDESEEIGKDKSFGLAITNSFLLGFCQAKYPLLATSKIFKKYYPNAEVL